MNSLKTDSGELEKHIEGILISIEKIKNLILVVKLVFSMSLGIKKWPTPTASNHIKSQNKPIKNNGPKGSPVSQTEHRTPEQFSR